MCPKIDRRQNKCQCYLNNFSKLCGNVTYPVLQHIGTVAKPNLVARKCHRYLHTTLIMKSGGLVSKFIVGIVGHAVINVEVYRKLGKISDFLN